MPNRYPVGKWIRKLLMIGQTSDRTSVYMQRSGARSILFIAGDMSGDIYTARLARNLAEHHSHLILHAIGGRHLGEAISGSRGNWLADTTNCSAIGLCSTLPMYLRVKLGQMKKMRRFVRANPVDLAVLCDWGAANCRQLTFFHREGIPTLYYFPPRSWKRTGNPGRQIVRFVTRVATPFKWSAERLGAAGCRAEWVGHPILESVKNVRSREDLRREFGVRADEKLIALLPGSRISEIRILAPRLAEVSKILSREPGVKFIVPISEQLMHMVSPYFPPTVQIVTDRTGDALTAADAAVVKTGTATLEAAVIGTPQVAVYDFGWVGRIEWLLLWMWKRIPFIAMPNIILQRMVVSELLGLSCSAEAIAVAVKSLLENDAVKETLACDYDEIRRHLGEDLPDTATARTVEIILEMLEEQSVETLHRFPSGPCDSNRKCELNPLVTSLATSSKVRS